MAEELEDPREVPWHPRLSKTVLGHDEARHQVLASLETGKPHHAWLMHGPEGIGKATLAYDLAVQVLGMSGDVLQARRWVETRAHPDLFILERSFTDTKPRRLRNEISVDDARVYMDHFSKTASGDGWRVGLVDCMDDLNDASSNALLKLIEEPPTRVLMFLICHQKGRILRTLQSRCRALPLQPLSIGDTKSALQALPLTQTPDPADLQRAAELSHGSPGRALTLLGSPAAIAFKAFRESVPQKLRNKSAITAPFAGTKSAVLDYAVFMDLLLEWVGTTARTSAQTPALAQAYAALLEKRGVTEAYNLDRRIAVLDHLYVLEDALKAA